MAEVTEEVTAQTPQAPAEAQLRILTPGVTAEETAIVVALFAGMSNGGGTAPKKKVREWNAPHRAVRRTLPHGAGAWRSSGLGR